MRQFLFVLVTSISLNATLKADESVELVISESVTFIGELTGFPETPLKPKSLMSIPKRYNEHSRHFYMVTPPPPALAGDKAGMGL